MRTVFTIATFLFTILVSSLVVAEEPTKHKWVGIGADIGIPEGAGVGIVAVPYFDFFKVNASFTHNYFTPGGRFGLTYDPNDWSVSPTITAEYGFAGSFNPSHIVGENAPDINYQYVNVQPGFEFGRRNGFRFFARIGGTYMWANTDHFSNTIKTDGFTVSNPRAQFLLLPTFKVGITALVF